MYLLKYIFIFSLLSIHIATVLSRSHRLILNNDYRSFFRMSTFGFLSGGKLEVQLNHLTFSTKYNRKIGFTLTKTASDSISPYMESLQNKCFLADDALTTDGNIQIISFLMDLQNNVTLVNCTSSMPFIDIKPGIDSNITMPDIKPRETSNQISDLNLQLKQKRSVDPDTNAQENTKKEKEENTDEKISENVSIHLSTETQEPAKESENHVYMHPKTCSSFTLPFKTEIAGSKITITDLKFVVTMKNEEAIGLYSLYFHNCAENDNLHLPVNLSISIVEHNGNNYLSAGEMPLPNLYYMMSLLFLLTGIFWVMVLRRKKEEAFKIHYLMGVLVFVKSLSLLFHGINYDIIAKEGTPMEAWAVLYYITHLLKGALLFITIVLIGTGWAFIKHILSDKDKKIFMIVIPLQVLANVAKIIMEESEEGQLEHSLWREIFILVDLICCGAILFPVVWSIRHLQEASQTDGKAAINLEKLKLFRHFYVMIVCYIYFTRIIVYLLKITVPFQFEFLDEAFREGTTYFFFVVTGMNFKPTTSNPYFRLSQEEEEMAEVITQTGFTENVSKTVRSRELGNPSEGSSTATKRESSHEYD